VTVPLSVVEAEVGELADLVDSKTHRDEYYITMLDPEENEFGIQ